MPSISFKFATTLVSMRFTHAMSSLSSSLVAIRPWHRIAIRERNFPYYRRNFNFAMFKHRGARSTDFGWYMAWSSIHRDWDISGRLHQKRVGTHCIWRVNYGQSGYEFFVESPAVGSVTSLLLSFHSHACINSCQVVGSLPLLNASLQ